MEELGRAPTDQNEHHREREVTAHALAVAQEFLGLPIHVVRERVAADGTIVLREIVPGQPVTIDHRPNRITVTVVEETVREVSPG